MDKEKTRPSRRCIWFGPDTRIQTTLPPSELEQVGKTIAAAKRKLKRLYKAINQRERT